MSPVHRHKGNHDRLNLADLASGHSENPIATSKAPRRRSSGLKFFASSATPKAELPQSSHKAWEASFLKDLRANRPARPGGSRPLPGRASTSTTEPYIRAASALSVRPSCSIQQPEPYDRSVSALSHRRAQSDMPALSPQPDHGGYDGPPTFSQPQQASQPRNISTWSPAMMDGTYRESGMRWMEKQEARSLREALENIDMRDDARLYAAAQDEASELVLKHRENGMPSKSPYQPYNYRAHLEKGAHARSQSLGWHARQAATSNDQLQGRRSASDGSNSSKNDEGKGVISQATNLNISSPPESSSERQATGETAHSLWDSPQKKVYMSLASVERPPKKTGRRRSSGARARHVSGGLFRNPNDRIYEEPESTRKDVRSATSDSSRIPAPLATKTRNTVSDLSSSKSGKHSRLTSGEEKQHVYQSEIHRNPPSQSRDPSYKQNGMSPAPPAAAMVDDENVDEVRSATRDGREIRGDDIRAATSKRMRDRSPKLPSPTVVSDRPGRPIVSFDEDWKPKATADTEDASSPRAPTVLNGLRFEPHMRASTASAPIIPTINLPEPPSIQISAIPAENQIGVPSISISEAPGLIISAPDAVAPPRALPVPSRSRPSPANRPLPHHSSTTPVHSSKLHWSPSSRRATAQCAACALPIEGRIVSASAQRFHPHCFTCHHCATALECVAFFPEPDSARSARLARIEARANSNSIDFAEEKPGETSQGDGDSSLRFYCHLDFHELYSPRCRSCKTPIETEVVLACGGSWHVGHFFCAECGDPFDAKTPFVEKDGFAWCVGCHAGRFSGKCRGCRRPVVDGGIMALGGEWHENCFSCVVSVHACFQKMNATKADSHTGMWR